MALKRARTSLRGSPNGISREMVNTSSDPDGSKPRSGVAGEPVISPPVDAPRHFGELRPDRSRLGAPQPARGTAIPDALSPCADGEPASPRATIT